MTQPVSIVDRTDFIESMKKALELNARRTAVVTIDCHRGHLDPAVATLPVKPEAAKRVVAATKRLVEFARAKKMPVIHVILVQRILPDGQPEWLHNPFWQAVEKVNQRLTPELPSTIRRHNIEGSPGTELMPELGPAPTDIVISTKRRLNSFGTDLDVTLRQLGIEAIAFAGVNTNTCMQNAAFDAMNLDYKGILISDCVHSMYGDDLHALGLQNVARCLGWVLTLEEFMAKV